MTDEYVYDDPDALYWAEDHMHGDHFRADAHTLARYDDKGRIIGVVVWDNFSVNNCFISVASDGGRHWFNRDFAIRATAYPFIQCGFPRISALVSIDNQESLRFTVGFGFQLEGKMRKAGIKGEDLLLFGMLREEWEKIRWTKYRPATLPATPLPV